MLGLPNVSIGVQHLVGVESSLRITSKNMASEISLSFWNGMFIVNKQEITRILLYKRRIFIILGSSLQPLREAKDESNVASNIKIKRKRSRSRCSVLNTYRVLESVQHHKIGLSYNNFNVRWISHFFDLQDDLQGECFGAIRELHK
ncbi:hypothetical protein V1477_011828 [Vespula maculifrons]|uniref:Uncharacterized protein n=1 Tax=Vespula maculifrons TaxID=7453 RepID=A0ABD2C0E4_VESMC